MDHKGISVAAFERSIGMSNASFGKSLKNKGAIGTDKLENILSRYSDISPLWLLTGEGNMLKRVLPALMKHYVLRKRREKRRNLKKSREDQRKIANVLLGSRNYRREAWRASRSYLPALWRAHSPPISPSWSTNANTILSQISKEPTSSSV